MAITVANLIAQIGADTTQFRRGMDEVDARMQQTASRAVSTENRVANIRDKALAATSESRKLEDQAVRAGNIADSVAAKVAAMRATQAASVPALQAQAEQLGRQVATMQRQQQVATAEAARQIQDFGLKTVVARQRAVEYATSAGNVKTAGKAAKLNAQALLQNNLADRLEADQAEAQAAEATRDQALRRQILIADAAANAAREKALLAATEDSDAIKKHVAREEALRETAGKYSAQSAGKRVESGLLSQSADDMERDAASAGAVAAAYSARLAENAREHQVRAWNTVSGAAQTAGLVITGSLGAATVAGAAYNKTIADAAHNTSLTTAGVEIMRTAVANMGQESGADLGQIAEGFQRVENFGYSAADATRITEAAMRSAVGAGSDMAQTTTLLARSMAQYQIPVGKAADVMNVMHVAANMSSLRLEELVSVGGQAYAMASNLGVSFVEANAAIVTFTKQGLDASTAMTQFRNDLKLLEQPSGKVAKELANIDKKFGVDLVSAFSYAGIKANGLGSAFEAIREAAVKMHVPVAELAEKLFPNLRGTIGAMIATSDKGFNDFNNSVLKLNDAMSGKLDPVTRQYNETLGLADTQFNRLKNSVTVLSGSISSVLTPVVSQLTAYVVAQTSGFNQLTETQRAATVHFWAISGVALVVVGSVGKLVVGLSSLKTAFLELQSAETLGAAFSSLGAGIVAATIAAGPWIIAGAALVAVGAGLYYWYTKLSETTAKSNEQMKEEAKQHEVAAAKKIDDINQTQRLVEQYQHLAKSAKEGSTRTAEMQGILDKISVLSPDLVTGFTNQGHAIDLVGVSAFNTTQQLAEMNKELIRAQRAPILIDRAQLGVTTQFVADRVSRLKELNAKGLYADPKDPHFLDTTSDVHSGSQHGLQYLDSSGRIVNPKTDSAMGRLPSASAAQKSEMAQALRIAESEYAQLVRKQADLEKEAFELGKPDKNAAKPKPTAHVNKDSLSDIDGSGKTKKAKEATDPLDEWREKILSLTEAYYKLDDSTKDPALAEVEWMRDKPGVQAHLDAIKTLGDLYAIASGHATRLNAAQKAAAEGKSFAESMRKFAPGTSRPPSYDPENLYDSAVYATQVDKSSVEYGFSAVHKKQYVDAAKMAQNAQDAKKAADQLKAVFAEVNGEVAKQETVYDQVLNKIKGSPQLYKEVGEVGAEWLAMTAYLADVEAKTYKVRLEEAKKYVTEYFGLIQKAHDKVLKTVSRNDDEHGKFTVFGTQKSDESYSEAASIELYGVALKNVDPFLAVFAYDLANLNKQFDNDRAVEQYTDKVARLKAQFSASGMKDGSYGQWLMRLTGQTEAGVVSAGTYNGLTNAQYKDEFANEQRTSQGDTFEKKEKDLRQTTEQMNLLSYASKDAKTAWVEFGVSLDSMSPEMQNRVHQLTQEMQHLNSIKKVQDAWVESSHILEQSFDSAFENMLDKHEKFWKTFAMSIESSTKKLLAEKASKGIVDLLGQITGLAHYGRSAAPTAGGQSRGQSATGGLSTVINDIGMLGGLSGSASGTANTGGALLTATSDIGMFGGMSGAASFIAGDGKAATPGVVGAGAGGPGALGGIASLAGLLGKGGLSHIFGAGAAHGVAAAMPWVAGFMALNALTGNKLGGGIDKLLHVHLFADGGRPTPHMPAIVGENGPELWVPDSHGTVVPNGSFSSNMGRLFVINNGDHHYHNAADEHRVAAAVGANVERRMRLS